jgi:hypothetical protein
MIQEYKLFEIYSTKVDYFLLRYDNTIYLIMSIIRIFLNKKIENFKEAQTIDRYSFERSNLLRGHQKKGKWAAQGLFLWKTYRANVVHRSLLELFLSFASP